MTNPTTGGAASASSTAAAARGSANPIAPAFPYDAAADGLACTGVPLAPLADLYGTPLFVYSSGDMLDRYRRIRDGLAPLKGADGQAPWICYSVKANSNLHLLRRLAAAGAGFDIVSGGELARVLEAGAAPETIVFAGVGKTATELAAGIDAGVGLFNVESVGELARLDEIAAARGVAGVRVALRINPDVDPRTPHAYITTGTKKNKFGIDLQTADQIVAAWAYPHLALVGLHLHIGSQIRDAGRYAEAVGKVSGLIERARASGNAIELVNLGGGFHVDYGEGAGGDFDLAAYAAAVGSVLDAIGRPRLVVEPGRSIAAAGGVLITRIEYVKQAGNRRFYIVDGAMNDLARPSLYGAYHAAWPVEGHGPPPPGARPPANVEACANRAHVVGPICETGDFLALDRDLPNLEVGALLAIFHAGAYAMSMASNYNTRTRAAEVLVEPNGNVVRIRRRETLDDLLAAEREA